jgi:dUTP pyrophosphatase
MPDHWHYHPVDVLAVRMAESPEWPLPARRTSRSSGYDIAACIDVPVPIAPGDMRIIPVGWAFRLPEGFELQIRPSFDCAVQRGLSLASSPVTIDSDFTEEIVLPVTNISRAVQTVERGDVLARMVVGRSHEAQFEIRDFLTDEGPVPKPSAAGDRPPPRGDVLASMPTRHEILDFLAFQEDRKATKTELYNHFKRRIARNHQAFRATLVSLLEDGLISFSSVQSQGRGRRTSCFWLECRWPPESSGAVPPPKDGQ